MNTESPIVTSTEMSTERLAHLERDRWPEFERELRLRRLWKIHFDLCQWSGERPQWGWLVCRCRKWEEVERVLNRHNVEYRWKHRRAVLELDGAEPRPEGGARQTAAGSPEGGSCRGTVAYQIFRLS